jgi:endonuclease/exonuclease/phosphatase family metal-dependent hydrolase
MRGLVLWLLAASFACATATTIKPAHSLRVVTYNVHLGKSLREERSGGRGSIRKAFQAEDDLRGVDILGLQELCGGEGGWQVDYFREVVGGPTRLADAAIAFADPSQQEIDPDIGPPCSRVEAIVSRFPIVASGTIVLPRIREPRTAVWADLEMPGESGLPVRLRVYNAHLENAQLFNRGEEGRRQQIDFLLGEIGSWRGAHPDSPMLLLGDLNTLGSLVRWSYREPALEAIEASGLEPSRHGHQRTLVLLPGQTDWIFSKHLELLDSKILHLWLSDHFPLIADYRR